MRDVRRGAPAASHVFSRKYLRTRFDLRNRNAISAPCTRRHNEDPSEYLRLMNERYGPDVVAELDWLRGNGRKVTDEELFRALERLSAMG